MEPMVTLPSGNAAILSHVTGIRKVPTRHGYDVEVLVDGVPIAARHFYDREFVRAPFIGVQPEDAARVMDAYIAELAQAVNAAHATSEPADAVFTSTEFKTPLRNFVVMALALPEVVTDELRLLLAKYGPDLGIPETGAESLAAAIVRGAEAIREGFNATGNDGGELIARQVIGAACQNLGDGASIDANSVLLLIKSHASAMAATIVRATASPPGAEATDRDIDDLLERLRRQPRGRRTPPRPRPTPFKKDGE